MLGCQFHDPVQSENDLRIHRMLDPGRSILVERRDPLLRRNEVRIRLVGRGLYEIQDCLLRRSVIPRRQKILRHGGNREQEKSADKRLRDKTLSHSGVPNLQNGWPTYPFLWDMWGFIRYTLCAFIPLNSA